MKQKLLINPLIFILFFLLAGCASQKTDPQSPSGLHIELLYHPEKTVITDFFPEFGWLVNSSYRDDFQTAYQIILSSSLDKIKKNQGDLWDSGKINSGQSNDVEYQGNTLPSNSTLFWKVRTWNKEQQVSSYSEPQMFRTGVLSRDYQTAHYPLEQHEIEPVNVVKKGDGRYFFDFGRAAFGTVKLFFDRVPPDGEIEVHLGEALKNENTIDDNPGGTIRYRKIAVKLENNKSSYVVEIPPDRRNTGPKAIKMPGTIGEVMPFRYCEIVNSPSDLKESSVKQLMVNYPFENNASVFESSNKILNDIWDLCKYSIKATSFCGVYVDGDRERIPYEADAYINQLCHYSVDREFTMARYSHEYLINHPTWPTEWIMHSVLIAWADYLYTGNSESLEYYYSDLMAKTLHQLERDDGLISSRTGLVTEQVLKSIHFDGNLRDIVDWPPGSFTKGGIGEQDGYVFTDINTVVNAFHYRSLILMSQIAAVLNKEDDASYFQQKAELVGQSINDKLFDSERKIYIDGIGTDHASLHGNMFPLVFGLVTEEYKRDVVDFIKSRGMACSVYGAQYLLEALYEVGEDQYALSLMTSTESDRSWPHMIYEVGTTITLEAWDKKYKENLDWNHAWGAAPANIIPRCLMGIQPVEPGFTKFRIKPQVANLSSGSLDLPTIKGTIHVDFKNEGSSSFLLNINLPANTRADICIPKLKNDSSLLEVDGSEQVAKIQGNFVVVENVGSGQHRFVRYAGKE
jgi:alpha-L-rhamnosidase